MQEDGVGDLGPTQASRSETRWAVVTTCLRSFLLSALSSIGLCLNNSGFLVRRLLRGDEAGFVSAPPHLSSCLATLFHCCSSSSSHSARVASQSYSRAWLLPLTPASARGLRRPTQALPRPQASSLIYGVKTLVPCSSTSPSRLWLPLRRAGRLAAPLSVNRGASSHRRRCVLSRSIQPRRFMLPR